DGRVQERRRAVPREHAAAEAPRRARRARELLGELRRAPAAPARDERGLSRPRWRGARGAPLGQGVLEEQARRARRRDRRDRRLVPARARRAWREAPRRRTERPTAARTARRSPDGPES